MIQTLLIGVGVGLLTLLLILSAATNIVWCYEQLVKEETEMAILFLANAILALFVARFVTTLFPKTK